MMLVFVCRGHWFGFCICSWVRWLGWGPFCGPVFLCVSVLKIASGPGMGLAGCGDALNPSVFYSTGYSGAVVPVLSCSLLWFVLRGALF